MKKVLFTALMVLSFITSHASVNASFGFVHTNPTSCLLDSLHFTNYSSGASMSHVVFHWNVGGAFFNGFQPPNLVVDYSTAHAFDDVAVSLVAVDTVSGETSAFTVCYRDINPFEGFFVQSTAVATSVSSGGIVSAIAGVRVTTDTIFVCDSITLSLVVASPGIVVWSTGDTGQVLPTTITTTGLRTATIHYGSCTLPLYVYIMS